MGKTSIIIPTYNERELLTTCIEAIRCHTMLPYEIIVADNGSTDGTLDYLCAERITFVSLPRNIGFPRACNVGLRLASGDSLLLLNNDVIVDRHWLRNLLFCLKSSNDTGIVGPLTNYASGRQMVHEPPFTNLQDMAESFDRDHHGKHEEVKRIIGLCFLFRRELMERIGLLDERFSPGHYEDDDYCFRARQVGYRLKIALDTYVFHHGSASFKKQDKQAVEQLIDSNKQKFIEKWNVDPTSFI